MAVLKSSHIILDSSDSVAALPVGTVAPCTVPPSLIPPVALSPIPHISSLVFAPYISTVATQHSRYRSLHQQRPEPSPSSSTDSLLLSPSTRPNLPSNQMSVPEVFFDPDFSLENPRIFAAVTDHTQVLRSSSSPSRKLLANNVVLQEKLSFYLDIIEISLINEIGSTSTSFFSALEGLRALEAESSHCIASIKNLRRQLALLHDSHTQPNLQLLHLNRRSANISILASHISHIQSICSRLHHIQHALDNRSDIAAALRLLHSITLDLDRYSYLRSVNALSNIDHDMHRLRLKAAKLLQDSLIHALLQDIHESLKTCVPEITTTSPRPSLEYYRFSDSFRDQIKHYLDLLHLIGFVDKATMAYREAVVREAKLIVKNNLPPEDLESNGTGTSRTTADKSIALAHSLRNMSPLSYNAMLISIYSLTCNFVRRIAAHEKLLLDLTSTQVDSTLADLTTSNGSETFPMPVSLEDIVGSTVDTAQGRIIKILAVRTDQNEKFGISEFIHLYSSTANFVTECEGLSGRPDRLSSLAKVIETDPWSVQDTLPKHQEIVQFVMRTATFDVSTQSPRISDAKTQYIVVDEQKYFVSSSLLCLLEMLQEYQQLSQTLVPHAPEIASSIIELFKLFNSRICQMILGAGATKAAGLKSITAKHLALASQSLGAIVALTPYIREFFRRHLSSASLLSEFDRVKREHQEEIHAKLVSIMGDRLQAHCKTMISMEWTSFASDGKANVYAQTLVKETLTLHRVLSRYLPQDTSIITRVFEFYGQRLVEAFSQVPISTAEEKSSLIEDAKFITCNLASLENIQGFGNMLIEAIENRDFGLNETET